MVRILNVPWLVDNVNEKSSSCFSSISTSLLSFLPLSLSLPFLLSTLISNVSLGSLYAEHPSVVILNNSFLHY